MFSSNIKLYKGLRMVVINEWIFMGGRWGMEGYAWLWIHLKCFNYKIKADVNVTFTGVTFL